MYIIPGRPVAWARPRLQSSSNRFYDSQKKEKERYKYLFKQQLGMGDLLQGPLLLNITFHFSYKSTNLSRLYKVEEDMPHFYRPDLSNLIKFVEDAAQGVLYKDDCAIAHIIAKKSYGERPLTMFTLEAIDMEEYEK